MPTLKEQGTDIVNYGWWGVCAASGTPKPILETLNKHVAAAVASAEFKSVIEKTGVIPVSSSVDEFGALIADTAKESGAMIKELGHRAAGLSALDTRGGRALQACAPSASEARPEEARCSELITAALAPAR